MPITSPGVENGAVLVRGDKIAAVGSWPEISRSCKGKGKVADLGDCVLLPGLVNAHCHLDYTSMAGYLPPMRIFTDWLKLITELKSGWGYEDYAESWRSGAEMLLRTGCTTVADIEAVPELLPDIWKCTPIRVLSFLEMIGITPRRSPGIVIAEIEAKLKELRTARHQPGISPHAPYSTVPDLLRKSAELASHKRLRICMHIAESRLEHEMFTRARGEMYDWISQSTRDMSDCGHRSPVKHAAHCGLLSERLIAVHVNYLSRGDARTLADARVNVVHCPRSHAYFGHSDFPLQTLLRAGVNISLGTDSLASVLKRRRQPVRLSMFDEMRTFLQSNAGMRPITALRMSTVAGARAIGLQGKVGEISPGAFADLIAIPGIRSRKGLSEQVVHYQGDVSGALINGKWAIAPESVRGTRPRTKRFHVHAED